MSSYELHLGDCVEYANSLPENSIDTVICDPPYELGFMNVKWDSSGIAFDPNTWAAMLRVAKPGAMLLAFGGSRTSHRMACAIEDAGWVIRDSIVWMYGSGFPKSADISKNIDKSAGIERKVVGVKGAGIAGTSDNVFLGGISEERKQVSITAPSTEAAKLWHGYGTALKPAFEPIIVAMKPLDGTFAQNAIAHGVAGLNIEGGRIPVGKNGKTRGGRGKSNGLMENWQPSEGYDEASGRWPANVILDEAAAAELDRQSGTLTSGYMEAGKERPDNNIYGAMPNVNTANTFADSGGASRFFYCAKAGKAERELGLVNFEAETVNDGRDTPIDNAYQRGETERKNIHPTVKPLSLMQYLCRLTKTPTGGVVFDPFTGSGTTGMAALLEGRTFIGCELMPDHYEIAKARIEFIANMKAGTIPAPKVEQNDYADMPLFAESTP